MGNQWQNVLVSAGVAAAMTVLVDFAVKPRLELRKDRILRWDRDRETLVAELLLLSAELHSAPHWVVAESRDMEDSLKVIEERAMRLHSADSRLRRSFSRPVGDLLRGTLIETAAGLEIAQMIVAKWHGGPNHSEMKKLVQEICREYRRKLLFHIVYARLDSKRFFARWKMRRQAKKLLLEADPSAALKDWVPAPGAAARFKRLKLSTAPEPDKTCAEPGSARANDGDGHGRTGSEA